MKNPNAYEQRFISNILTISISHISEQDNQRLLKGLSLPDSIGVCFTLDDCGFLIHATPNMKKKDLNRFKPNGFTKAIGKIILYAQSVGCDYIRLESFDDNFIPDLKVYNW